jgi:hypothetical protein
LHIGSPQDAFLDVSIGPRDCETCGVSITWSCRPSVAEYAALGRSAHVPRCKCADCGEMMS